MHWVRKRILNVRCKKCLIYDTSVAFQSDDAYLACDEGTPFSFVDNNILLTQAGLDRLRPLYRQLVQQ